jgi:hypothetical protein
VTGSFDATRVGSGALDWLKGGRISGQNRETG